MQHFLRLYNKNEKFPCMGTFSNDDELNERKQELKKQICKNIEIAKQKRKFIEEKLGYSILDASINISKYINYLKLYEKVCPYHPTEDYYYALACLDPDIKFLQESSDKMIYNKQKHAENIILMSTKLKPGCTKKYQISGYHEWDILKQKLKYESNLLFSLEKEKEDSNIKYKVLSNIKPDIDVTYNTGKNFVHIKIPVMFVKITKIYLKPFEYRHKKYFMAHIAPELISNVWHPKNIDKFSGLGFDWEVNE